jgi:hypothetical protein
VGMEREGDWGPVEGWLSGTYDPAEDGGS